MANLEANQALQIVKGKLNYNHSKLEAAALQDERMQLHTYSANDSKELPYYEKYIKKVSMIISPEKLNVFKNLQSIPFETSEILEENYRQIEKIFETEDRNITHSFKTPKNKEDFEKYLKEINDFNFWKTEGMSMLKSILTGI